MPHLQVRECVPEQAGGALQLPDPLIRTPPRTLIHMPHLQVGEGVLEQADGALRQAVGVERLLGGGGLQVVGGLRTVDVWTGIQVLVMKRRGVGRARATGAMAFGRVARCSGCRHNGR